MQNKEDFYRQILDHVSTGIYFVDRQRVITYWNQGAEEISGYMGNEVVGRACGQNVLMHTDDEGRILCHTGCPLQASMDDGKTRSAEIYMQHKSGVRVPVAVHSMPIRDASGEITGAVEIFDDLTPMRTLEHTIDELNDRAFLDDLTSTASRRFIDDILQARWDSHIKDKVDYGIIFADLDELKPINDAHGHLAGDKAISHVAQTLKNGTREDDIVGRWGGDEFIVILKLASSEKLNGVMRKLETLLKTSTVVYKEDQFRVSASFGAALFSEADTLDDVIELADKRMYQQKD
ncbi:MAG: sensor domain-containing diguanylate cyclase [Chloroflexi bacterium]|nr:MAG: sensor domain-containing diguanylate cyclase [Chloroflexota bacterium]MBL1195895.1 sensor domain-containing diguanylate cyclase [Chloroflexota bacterium]NOH13187.1 GGDEF domain-containing protein [Chloroflexota bacterium]